MNNRGRSLSIREKKRREEGGKRSAGVRPNSTDLIRYDLQCLNEGGRRPHSASRPLFAVNSRRRGTNTLTTNSQRREREVATRREDALRETPRKNWMKMKKKEEGES